MTEPVSFKIAKLLKEKGFDKSSKMIYNTEGELSNIHFSVLYYAPTIAQVVMWLYEKHGIWIGVKPSCDGIEWYSEMFTASEQSWNVKDKRHSINTAFRDYNSIHSSPIEAYETAIEYTLNTLI